jgi:hypothetical protein
MTFRPVFSPALRSCIAARTRDSRLGGCAILVMVVAALCCPGRSAADEEPPVVEQQPADGQPPADAQPGIASATAEPPAVDEPDGDEPDGGEADAVEAAAEATADGTPSDRLVSHQAAADVVSGGPVEAEGLLATDIDGDFPADREGGCHPAACGPVSGSCCDTHYAVVDALFLQRNNAAVDRPIAVDTSAPGAPILSAADPTSVVGTGTRLLYGSYGDGEVGWEAGYLGVWGMHAVADAASPAGTLQAAGDLGLDPLSPFRSATLARATVDSTVQSADLNLVLHRCDGGFNRRSGNPWQRCRGYDGGHVDWLAGFRWAGLDESAVLAFTSSPPQPSTYTVRTNSNLFAAQFGTRGRMAWERWAFEGGAKIAVAGTSLFQSQSTFDAFTGDPVRQPSASRFGGMGMIAELGISAVYRFNETWGLRVGYTQLWLTGVALAEDQWSFKSVNAPGAGTGLNSTGSVYLGGATLGLEARW